MSETKTIYKYALPVEAEFALDLPEGAQVLDVQVQGGVPCLWALVEPLTPTERRRFHLRGTGHDAGNVGRYIATFQMHDGALVLHAFEAA